MAQKQQPMLRHVVLHRPGLQTIHDSVPGEGVRIGDMAPVCHLEDPLSELELHSVANVGELAVLEDKEVVLSREGQESGGERWRK